MMLFFTRIWIAIGLVGGGFSSVFASEVCESGFKSFEQSVYRKIMKSCAECHDGSRDNAPPFAVADAKVGYRALLNYVNFSDVDNSLLVVRAGNGHCEKDELCGFESGEEMYDGVKKWWSEGEKDCNRFGKLFTKEIDVPKDLPTDEDKWVRVSFDLGVIRQNLKGVKLELDMQEYQPIKEFPPKAYRFRQPRLLNLKANIMVKDIKVLLNGKFDAVYNQFTLINKNVSPVKVTYKDEEFQISPVLSPQTLIVLKDEEKNPQISVSFEIVEATREVVSCGTEDRQTTAFRGMRAFWIENSCQDCHGKNPPADMTLGGLAFNVDSDEGPLCSVSKQLTYGPMPIQSSLIAFPIRGLGGHPALEGEKVAEFYKLFDQWVQAEGYQF